MKKTRKVLALALSLLMVFTLTALPVSAEESQQEAILDTSLFKTDYPYIFVHGMGGWGSADPYYAQSPYWGGGLIEGSDNDIIRILNEKGVKAYAASVGALSSAWDRACELYAQLTGTVTDYGEAHSKAHNHDRYGEDYTQRCLLGEPWNTEDKINLVGHSFGGATIRLFTSLLAYGNEAEIAATGKDTSPLFTGGHHVIHSCSTLSAPHNGSQVSNLIVDTRVPLLAIAFGLNVVGALNLNTMPFGLHLGHYSITAKENEARAKFSIRAIVNFYRANDNSGYDLTIKGAAELNEMIKAAPETYYYSYSTAATEPTGLFGRQEPVDSVNGIFKTSAKMIALTEGRTIDGVKIEGDWAVNDGIVPLASALYPLDEKDNAYDYEEALKTGDITSGSWYYLDTMYGMDHFDFCGAEDYPTSFEQFYFDMVTTANSR